MYNELAPGVLALVVGLVVDVHLNGLSVELYEFVEGDNEIFYDPTDGHTYYFHEDELGGNSSWGCITSSTNDYLFFEPKNLLPIGKKSSEKEKEKEVENELCKST